MVNAGTASFRPNYAVPPGETLLETLEALGMTQAQLAERAGRPLKTINEIIRGKAAITAETALQFERVLGVPASFWNNLERNFRETLARLEEEKRLAKDVGWLREIPWRAMVKLGWLPKADSKIEQLRSVLGFFGVAGLGEWRRWCEAPAAAYRKSKAFRSHPSAVAAWLRRGDLEAQEITCRPYDAKRFRNALEKARSLTVEPPEAFVPGLQERCAAAGVAVVFVPELPHTCVFGATRWLSPSKALIQLSLRYKSDDHLWFTFFHEAAHILLHRKREVFIEEGESGSKKREATDELEVRADRFAADALIPRRSYCAFTKTGLFDLSAVQSFAEQVGIAPGIVVGRLQHDGLIPFSEGNSLKRRFEFVQA